MRPPGYSVGKELDEMVIDVISYLFGFVVIGTVFAIIIQSVQQVLSQLILLIFVSVVQFVLFYKMHRHLRAAWSTRLGYDGELYVGQELNLLMRQGAWVFHDVPYKYGNIDHVIVASGGVFTIETKAVRKPASENGRAESRVRIENDTLVFPHARNKTHLDQARRHADYLTEFIRADLGLSIKAIPVLALPGWYVERDNVTSGTNVLVINPKRGHVLSNMVARNLVSDTDAHIIAARVESFARTVNSGSEILDPDAAKKFDFWNNRRVEEPRL